MSLILHLSDLHLAGREHSQATGDHKSGLVPVSQRATFYDTLALTMQGIRESLRAVGRQLDAIVITGDIAHQNSESGYEALVQLIAELAEIGPPVNHVVAVPGNHDVRPGLPPKDPERYRTFVHYIRGAGYVTPLLDGIDAGPPSSEVQLRRHLLQLEDLEIVPLNTSGYSHVLIDTGIREDQWSNLEEVLSNDSAAVDALRKLRLVDAARVSEDHLRDTHSLLSLADKSRRLGANATSPLRLAIMHHHLLPVTLVEEVKSYESLTNLALVRQFLSTNGVPLVLHGHKHAEFTYVDYVPDYYDAMSVPRPVRVVAGPAPCGSTFDPSDVCRLIDIESDRPYLLITSVPAGVAGSATKFPAPRRLPFAAQTFASATRTAGTLVIDGDDIRSVYRQLIANIETRGTTERVLCRIGTSPNDDDISLLYPGFATVNDGVMEEDDEGQQRPEERRRLFRELVEWWQQPALVSTQDQPAFTHGTRILRYDGHLDQLEEVAEALRSDPGTSRGIVVLLNPSADHVSVMERQFPSFCMAQFLVRDSDAGSRRLECIAYFRKQEVRYWWLVNVAELASLQRKLVEALMVRGRQKGPLTGIRSGSITTFATLVHAGQSPPKVQVPKIDQYFTRQREKLFAMVNALVWQEMPDRASYARDWLEVLLSLIPSTLREPDGVAVAVEGIRYVVHQVNCHLAGPPHQTDEQLSSLSLALERVLSQNTTYLRDEQLRRVDQDRHTEWRNAVEPLIREIISLTYARILAERQE